MTGGQCFVETHPNARLISTENFIFPRLGSRNQIPEVYRDFSLDLTAMELRVLNISHYGLLYACEANRNQKQEMPSVINNYACILCMMLCMMF